MITDGSEYFGGTIEFVIKLLITHLLQWQLSLTTDGILSIHLLIVAAEFVPSHFQGELPVDENALLLPFGDEDPDLRV